MMMSKRPDDQFASMLKRKRRRASSGAKVNSNIYFNFESNRKVATVLQQKGATEIQISDCVLRVVADFKLVEYNLIITQKTIYLFKSSSGNLKHEIPIKSLETIVLSHQSDNFILLKVRREAKMPDFLFVSKRKSQITEILVRQTHNQKSDQLLTISDKLTFNHMDNQKYLLVFSRTQFGVETSIYPAPKVADKSSVKMSLKSN